MKNLRLAMMVVTTIFSLSTSMSYGMEEKDDDSSGNKITFENKSVPPKIVSTPSCPEKITLFKMKHKPNSSDPQMHLRNQVFMLEKLEEENPLLYKQYTKNIKNLDFRHYLPWLSFTGGGSRGIISAKILTHFEEKTRQQTKDLFPFMAGTSTGGLLATLFKLGIPGKKIVKLYKECASEIFEPNFWMNPMSLRGPEYNIENLQKLIEKHVGNKRLSDIEGDLMVTSVNASRMQPHVFKSWEARENLEDPIKNPTLIEVLSATAAAPTFFDPSIIQDESYVDGGLFANDPVMCAYAEIKQRYGKVNHIAISLGTGQIEHEFVSTEKLVGRSSVNQVKDIINYSINCSQQSARDIVSILLPNIGSFQQYYVIDPPVSTKFSRMDTKNPKNLKQLEIYAEEYIERESKNTWMGKLLETVEQKHKMGKIAQPQQKQIDRVILGNIFNIEDYQENKKDQNNRNDDINIL